MRSILILRNLLFRRESFQSAQIPLCVSLKVFCGPPLVDIKYCCLTDIFLFKNLSDHQNLCVPKGSCLLFDIISKSSSYYADYSLEMDGITYRSGGWDASKSLKHSTNLGRCTVDELCDQTKQALFELDIETSSEFTTGGTSYPAINYYDVHWLFGNFSQQSKPDIFFQSFDYISSSYDLGSVYRTIECVSDANCELDLNMTATFTTPIHTYTVRRNGRVLSPVVYGGDELTAFGQQCGRAPTSPGSTPGSPTDENSLITPRPTRKPIAMPIPPFPSPTPPTPSRYVHCMCICFAPKGSFIPFANSIHLTTTCAIFVTLFQLKVLWQWAPHILLRPSSLLLEFCFLCSAISVII